MVYIEFVRNNIIAFENNLKSFTCIPYTVTKKNKADRYHKNC